jgi:hypothetical protein
LSSFGLTHSHDFIRTSGAHDWRRAATTAVVTWSLVYGLDFLLGALALDIGTLFGWLSVLVFASGIILAVKVKVLGGGLCAYGWVTICDIVYGENEHTYYFNN